MRQKRKVLLLFGQCLTKWFPRTQNPVLSRQFGGMMRWGRTWWKREKLLMPKRQRDECWCLSIRNWVMHHGNTKKWTQVDWLVSNQRHLTRRIPSMEVCSSFFRVKRHQPIVMLLLHYASSSKENMDLLLLKDKRSPWKPEMSFWLPRGVGTIMETRARVQWSGLTVWTCHFSATYLSILQKTSPRNAIHHCEYLMPLTHVLEMKHTG